MNKIEQTWQALKDKDKPMTSVQLAKAIDGLSRENVASYLSALEKNKCVESFMQRPEEGGRQVKHYIAVKSPAGKSLWSRRKKTVRADPKLVAENRALKEEVEKLRARETELLNSLESSQSHFKGKLNSLSELINSTCEEAGVPEEWSVSTRLKKLGIRLKFMELEAKQAALKAEEAQLSVVPESSRNWRDWLAPNIRTMDA